MVRIIWSDLSKAYEDKSYHNRSHKLGPLYNKLELLSDLLHIPKPIKYTGIIPIIDNTFWDSDDINKKRYIQDTMGRLISNDKLHNIILHDIVGKLYKYGYNVILKGSTLHRSVLQMLYPNCPRINECFPLSDVDMEITNGNILDIAALLDEFRNILRDSVSPISEVLGYKCEPAQGIENISVDFNYKNVGKYDVVIDIRFYETFNILRVRRCYRVNDKKILKAPILDLIISL